jgi:hypothetical protein
MEKVKSAKKPAQELNKNNAFSLLHDITRDTCDEFTDMDSQIQKLDLVRIMWKMADPEEGKGFTPQRLAQAEMDYRRFLHLHLQYPSLEIVPTKLIDEVWHQHILDTRAYAKDCEDMFGEFLHHYPYFGMRGEEDQANLQACFERTQVIWKDYFGVPIFETQAVRCEGHACHSPSSCACRSPGACK